MTFGLAFCRPSVYHWYMTCDEPRNTTTTGDLAAAHARYTAINRAYRQLTNQAYELVAAVGAEWEAADELLHTVQSQPGIDLPATGREYTHSEIEELERLAYARLAEMFPWATIKPSA